jgi:CDP-4-dehydro-6-deoxyglucose reductase/ferredoxin-NAD(P)+ reductase (naphthalene dioxygenase ferredoxin-specific)
VVGARDGAGIQIIRDLACVVSALEHVTPGTVMLDLAPPSGESLLFAAGQYAVLTFPGQPPREYSMASRPDAPALRFHIRHVPNGRVSRHVLHDLAVGDPVLLRGPYGAAYLHEEHLGPLLLAAGGSGLAPIRSILETGLALGMTQPIHLYVGARNEADLYHEDELRRLAARHRNLRLVTALSEPAEETPRRQGLLCDIVAEDFDDFDAFHAYVAGPPAHCDAMRRMLRDRGLAEDCCFIDPFFTARDRAAG